MKRHLSGVMAVAMLLIVGLIAPATAELVELEPNACQYVEYEYMRTVATDGVTDWFADDPGEGWEATGGERLVEGETGTEYEYEYIEIIFTIETDWFADDPGEGWEVTGAARLVDIPNCDPYELDPSNPAAGQCPAEEGAIKLDTGDSYSSWTMVDGVEVEVTVDGKIVTFSSEVTFCVKASNGNSGYRTGTSYDVDFVNRGGQYPDISNVVLYSRPVVEPGTVTMTLAKEWFDAEGGRIEAPSDVNWSLDLIRFELEGEEVVDVPVGTSAEFEPGQRYGVQESFEGDGSVAVDCTGLPYEVEGVVAYNTSTVSVAGGAPDGTFGVPEGGGIHLVCNRFVPTTTTTPATPTPTPTTPTPTPTPTTPTPAPTPAPDDDVEVLPAPPLEAEDPVEEPEIVTPEPEVVEPEPEVVTPEPEVVEPEAQVLGRTVTRTTPTRIDSGTGGSQDNSGLLALLLMGGLALSGFGITSAATARRRR